MGEDREDLNNQINLIVTHRTFLLTPAELI